MEELRDLINILNGNKAKYLEIIRPHDDSKSSKLYNTILSNPLLSENDIFLSIYKSNENKSKFRQLKSRLEKKLINSLFIIDINKSSFNESNKAYYECHRYWAAVKILFQKKSYRIGTKLAEKLFKQSVKYEFSEITVSIAGDLRRIYGIEFPNEKKYKKYKKAFHYYLPIYMMELEAEEVTATLHKIISKQTNFDYTSLSQKIEKELIRLSKYEANSFSFNKYYFISSIYHELLRGNDAKIIEICNVALEYFERKDYPVLETINLFQNQKIYALINTNHLKEAAQAINNSTTEAKSGSRNWHFTKVMEFIVKMYNREYVKANEVYHLATTKDNIKGIHENIKEFWRIFNAYLQFLIVRKILILDESEKTKFSINKFLNEVPQYSKDKQGLNVAIHIIHILFLIHLRKFNVIIDRMESLQLYTYRHLRRDATFRSNCFIKMLVQIPKGNFVRKRVVRYTDKYWTKLQTAPVNVNNQQTTLEIIPYETLWEMVLDMLD